MWIFIIDDDSNTVLKSMNEVSPKDAKAILDEACAEGWQFIDPEGGINQLHHYKDSETQITLYTERVPLTVIE